MDKVLDFLAGVFLHKRMKAFYWSVGAMLASELAFILPSVLTDFEVPQWAVVLVGLVLAQITKYLNTKKV